MIQVERRRVEAVSSALLNVAPFAMLVADERASVHTVNQRWVDMSGLGQGDSLGVGWLGAVDRDHQDRLRHDVIGVASSGESAKRNYPISGPAGQRWARWWISRHEIEGSSHVVITAADIHEEQEEQADLYHLATHDHLTGLLNRRLFIDSVEQAIRRNERSAKFVGLLYIDLDGFKNVNDRAGHSVGDRVLAAIAGRLRLAVRSADLVARIGGDEFAVLLEGMDDPSQTDPVVRRVEASLNGSVELDGTSWPIAASVGVAVAKGTPTSVAELLEQADQSMYGAKRRRRSLATPAPSPSSSRRHPVDQTLEEFAALRQTVELMQRTIERLLSAGLPPNPA
jgi:diguanylate cyclase (GGDEF)-like protein/PAS domain S-box-containing protein